MILLLVPVILRRTFASLKRLKDQGTRKVVGEGGATCGERKAKYVRFKAKGTDFTSGFFWSLEVSAILFLFNSV